MLSRGRGLLPGFASLSEDFRLVADLLELLTKLLDVAETGHAIPFFLNVGLYQPDI